MTHVHLGMYNDDMPEVVETKYVPETRYIWWIGLYNCCEGTFSPRSCICGNLGDKNHGFLSIFPVLLGRPGADNWSTSTRGMACNLVSGWSALNIGMSPDRSDDFWPSKQHRPRLIGGGRLFSSKHGYFQGLCSFRGGNTHNMASIWLDLAWKCGERTGR